MSGIALFASAAVIAIAAAAIGSAHAQGKTAQAAIDATWRQPERAGNIFVMMLLALAFMEALTLFVFALVFVLAGRIPA